MKIFNWNPVYREIIRLKEEYVAKNGPSPLLYDPNGYKTCVDKWIAGTNDPFWSDVRPFLILKQCETAILFKYGNLAVLADLAEEKGFNTTEELWTAWDGFLQSCRSITIDVQRELILTSPFDKFFNIDELSSTSWDIVKNLMANAKEIEFSNKLDGSICIARYLEFNDFYVTTSGSLDDFEEQATVLRDVKKMFFSFSENSVNIRRMMMSYPQYTFMFEYIAVDNRIVVKYSKEDEGLYLIGMRDVFTGEQLSYHQLINIAKEFNVKVTTIFEEKLDALMDLIHTKTSDEMEGFVINIDGRLFKLKTDDYVKIHKLISKISAPNVILKAIADGIYDDLLAKVPDSYKEDIQKLARVIYKYEEDMEKTTSAYYEKAPKEDKKEFMVWVTNNVPAQVQGAVRNLYLGKTNNFLKRERGKGNYQYTKMKDIDPDFLDKFSGLGEKE